MYLFTLCFSSFKFFIEWARQFTCAISHVNKSGGFLFSCGEKQSTDIPSKLGVEYGEWGGIYETNDWGKTKVDGLYIVGDAKNNFTGVIGAAAEGSVVAEMITHEIINERWIS